MDVNRYMERLGIVEDMAHWRESFVPDLEHLRLLQRKHIFEVPFENIDIYYGIPVEYSVEAFYKKIVTRNRGGYCYELNGLFYWLLTSLGYGTTLISGLVMGKKEYITEFEHMAIIVDVDGSKWLVDVGFGDSSWIPVRLVPGKIQNDNLSGSQYAGRDYRIIEDIIVDGKNCMSFEKWNKGTQSFVTLYSFTLERRAIDYFMLMHEYQEMVPTAYYKENLLCSLPTRKGRISVINNRLIETTNGTKRIKKIENSKEQVRLFRKIFRLDVSIHATSKFVDAHRQRSLGVR
ncbi:MAG: arylamine N-acetyltransferase family protein [Candidatus Kryptoniota bacterium]